MDGLDLIGHLKNSFLAKQLQNLSLFAYFEVRKVIPSFQKYILGNTQYLQSHIQVLFEIQIQYITYSSQRKNMKNQLIILATILAVAFSQQAIQQNLNDQLTIQTLISSNWNFYNDIGFLGVIRLSADGKVYNFDNFNERFWLLDDQGFLVFKRGDGVTSCRFVHAHSDYNGKWHLEGRLSFSDKGQRHYVIQQ